MLPLKSSTNLTWPLIIWTIAIVNLLKNSRLWIIEYSQLLTTEEDLLIYNTVYDAENEETLTEKNGVNDPIFRKNSTDERPGAIDVTDGQNTLLNDTQYEPVYINRNGVVKKLLQYVESRNEEDQTVVLRPAIDRKLVSLAVEGSEKQDAKLRTAKIADNIKIDGSETKTFALVLYIKNENIDQTATDAEKVFQGQVVVSSGDGSSGVSGYIGLAEQSQEGLQSNTQGS